MSRNRILPFIGDRTKIARLHSKRLLKEAQAVEAIIGSVAEFVVPSVKSLLDGKRSVLLFLKLEPDLADVRDDLRVYAEQQLRAMSRELSAAADRLSGGEE